MQPTTDRGAVQRLIEARVPASHLLGAGPVYVAAFVDFACGASGRAFVDVMELLRLRRSLARVALLPAPWESRGRQDYAGGERAALAAEAAALQGRFVEVARLLFEAQADIGQGRNLTARVGEAAGLDVARLEHDMTAAAPRRQLDDFVGLAEELGVARTPTFFVEGVPFEAPSLHELLAAVDAQRPPHVKAS